MGRELRHAVRSRSPVRAQTLTQTSTSLGLERIPPCQRRPFSHANSRSRSPPARSGHSVPSPARPQPARLGPAAPLHTASRTRRDRISCPLPTAPGRNRMSGSNIALVQRKHMASFLSVARVRSIHNQCHRGIPQTWGRSIRSRSHPDTPCTSRRGLVLRSSMCANRKSNSMTEATDELSLPVDCTQGVHAGPNRRLLAICFTWAIGSKPQRHQCARGQSS